MRPFDLLSYLFIRFRYPVSMPQDIAEALGASFCNTCSFDELMDQLLSSNLCISRLKRYMPREMAEKAFATALRKECFGEQTLFSYYFSEGWMEFILHFDKEGKLRRMYIQHRCICNPDARELPLSPLPDPYLPLQTPKLPSSVQYQNIYSPTYSSGLERT